MPLCFQMQSKVKPLHQCVSPPVAQTLFSVELEGSLIAKADKHTFECVF